MHFTTLEGPLTPEKMLMAYAGGLFPMALSATGKLDWFSPDPRAILPLDGFWVPRNLDKLVRRGRFDIRFDQDFEGTMRGCAHRDETWISEEIVDTFVALHEAGYAHSVECRLEGRLVGGLYGVALGGAFFGESMFSWERDASKVALVHLVNHLRDRGFFLLDVQYTTPHLQQFGVIEISREVYQRRLARALLARVSW